MSIGSRINQLRTSRELTMDALAEALNINTSNISKYENDKYLPSAETILALSQFFGVTTDWILKGMDPAFPSKKFVTENNLIESFKKLSDAQKERVLERIEIYLSDYNDSLSSGSGAVEEDDRTYEIPFKFKTKLWGDISAGGGIDVITNIEEIDSPVECDYALRVKGDSMEPVFKNRSIIYINETKELQYNGEILAVGVDNDWGFLKRVYDEGNRFRLVSINPEYKDLVFPIDRIVFWGKVIYPKVEKFL